MCEARDVKGLYKKAREGSIAGFTGVSQEYEAPQSPDLIVTTEGVSIRESTNRLIDLLEEENVIPKNLRDIEVVSMWWRQWADGKYSIRGASISQWK